MAIHVKDSYYLRLITAAIFIFLSMAGVAFAIYIMLVSSSIYVYFFGIFLLVLSIIAGFFNSVSAYFYYKSFFYDGYLAKITAGLNPPIRRFPTVAIGVPAKNEDPKVVEKTLMRLREMNYPKDKMNIYLLDDSTNTEISKELKSFCKRNRLQYLQRVSKTGFKAGNLNNMLNHSKEEFVAVFDYDEYLTNKNFLMDLIPYFQDAKVGYVQTEKSSFKGNLLSDSVNLFDAFFFKFIQPARAFNNTAIFSGSCGVIRRKVLDEIGGFPEYIIEDTFFSFMSDMHNYKGLYVPKVYAYGKPVLTFSALIKQQWRYNYGDTQFLMFFVGKNKIKRDLPAQVTAEYISHGFGLNYLSVMLILFTVTSVMIVFSNLPFFHVGILKFISSANNNLIGLELFGMAAFALSFLTPAILTKIYFNSFSKGFMIFVLNFSLAVVRTKAALWAVLRINPANTQWAKAPEGNKFDIRYALYKTKYEIALAVVLFAFSALAVLSNNIEGGLWLVSGMLYLCATLMVLKYG